MNQPERCWHCGHPVSQSVFCEYCNRIQPPTTDYFRFFGLQPRLNLDPEDLRQRFYTLSRKLHPDRHSQATPREQRYSLEASAVLNDAYRVLRDPVARAEYVLRREGLAETGTARPTPPELLEEIFELNAVLEQFRDDPQAGRPALEQACQRLRLLRRQADDELSALASSWDQCGERRILEQIRDVLERRRFVCRLESQVEEELSRVGAARN